MLWVYLHDLLAEIILGRQSVKDRQTGIPDRHLADPGKDLVEYVEICNFESACIIIIKSPVKTCSSVAHVIAGQSNPNPNYSQHTQFFSRALKHQTWTLSP
eukprot:scaffold273096_cov16-Prasinocladus_malaysianus.AAC.1